MERLHRESGDKEPRLTALSQSHLEAGAKALIDAMADVVSLGVVFVGGKVAGKVGPAVKKGLLKPPAEARLKLTVDGSDTVIVVEPVKAEDEVGTGWLERLLQKGKEGDGAAAEPPEAEPDAQQPGAPASLGKPDVAPAQSQPASAGEGVGSAATEARNPEKGDGEPEEPRGTELEAEQPQEAAEAPPSPGGEDPAKSQATPQGEGHDSAATEAFEKKAAESWKDRSIEEDGPYVGKGMKGKTPESGRELVPRINVASRFSFKRKKNGRIEMKFGDPEVHGLEVSVDKEGVMGLNILKSPLAPESGVDMILSAMERLKKEGVSVEKIRGYWIDGTNSVNAAEYKANIQKNMTPKAAAAETWTGRLARALGYGKVESVTGSGTTKVIFVRSE